MAGPNTKSNFQQLEKMALDVIKLLQSQGDQKDVEQEKIKAAIAELKSILEQNKNPNKNSNLDRVERAIKMGNAIQTQLVKLSKIPAIQAEIVPKQKAIKQMTIPLEQERRKLKSQIKVEHFSKNKNETTCLNDWNRWLKSDVFFVNRVSLKKIKEEKMGKEPFETYEQLQAFWKEHIIKPMGVTDKKQQDALLDHCLHYFHQGGCLMPLQTSLCETAAASKYSVDDRSAETRIGFMFKPDTHTLCIVSDTKIKRLQNVESLGKVVEAKEGCLTAGVTMQEISLDKQGKVKHDIKAIDVKHYNKQAETILDKRSAIQKCFDYFSSMFKSDKKIKIAKSAFEEAKSPAGKKVTSDSHDIPTFRR